MSDYELIVSAGRVFCAVSGFDGPGAVAVKGDRIVAVGAEVEGSAWQTLDFPGDLLLTELVDMHAHPARGGGLCRPSPGDRLGHKFSNDCVDVFSHCLKSA
tara:strand:- start:327 stop:629 length:303 start_codon:yes stop_codon:yes gene_type:complete